jgi:hypothetical protein
VCAVAFVPDHAPSYEAGRFKPDWCAGLLCSCFQVALTEALDMVYDMAKKEITITF